MTDMNEKLEETKVLLRDVSQDLIDMLSVVQISVPMVHDTVDKMKLRASQIEKLFSSLGGKAE